ncbi:MAG: hypothetical protein U0174_11475 [Polyangiaceae bacterium]
MTVKVAGDSSTSALLVIALRENKAGEILRVEGLPSTHELMDCVPHQRRDVIIWGVEQSKDAHLRDITQGQCFPEWNSRKQTAPSTLARSDGHGHGLNADGPSRFESLSEAAMVGQYLV